jgi:hypothetical protein
VVTDWEVPPILSKTTNSWMQPTKARKQGCRLKNMLGPEQKRKQEEKRKRCCSSKWEGSRKQPALQKKKWSKEQNSKLQPHETLMRLKVFKVIFLNSGF